MKATASIGLGASGSVPEPATPDLATAPPSNIVSDHRAANADDYRPKFGRLVEAAASGIAHAPARIAQRLRDGLDRRRTVRELRLMDRSRLVDIGIEPNGIERVVDDMIAARRRHKAKGERRTPPRSE